MIETATLLTDAVEALDDGLAVFGAEGRAVYTNRAYRERFAKAGVPQPGEDIEVEILGGWARVKATRDAQGRVVALYRDITARRADLMRLLHAVEALEEPFALCDAEERLVICNGAMRRYMGETAEILTPGTPAEAILRSLANSLPNLVTEEQREAFLQNRLGILRGSAPVIEFRDGVDHWSRGAVRRLPGGDTVVMIADITPLKRRERELAAARDAAHQAGERLTQAMESFTGGFVLFDAEERLVVCNEVFRKIMGQAPAVTTPGARLEDGLRQLVAMGLAPQGADAAEAWVQQRLAWLRAGDRVFEMPTGSGIVSRVYQHRTPDGGTVVVLTDISELKAHERELELRRDAARQAEERLTQAIEALTDPFALRDAEERLIACNEAYRRMMLHVPELITPGTFLEPGARAFGEKHFGGPPERRNRLVEEGLTQYRTAVSGFEVRIARDRWGRLLTRVAPNGDRVTVIPDITDLKRRAEELALARDAAEEANRAKSAFLATMSHEIRTPMNGVLGMMEVLERQGLGEEQRQSVALMRDSATALLRIIDDILDFSKIEAGRLELEQFAFAPRELITGVVDTLTVRAEAQRLVLIGHVAEEVPEQLLGDSTRIRQILFNLVGNALKFTERGFVRVSLGAEPARDGQVRLKLAVEDSGIGMSGAETAKLFQPFVQADSSTTRRYGGSGLGLSIVKRLAEQMGGDVTVDSVPGRGSVFTVTLLLAEAQAGAPARTAPAAAVAVGGRVLVVDDHPVNREVLSRQLALIGVESDTAADGVEGLERWQAGGYAAILADLHMPEMDGYELARRIRAAETANGQARTPIVAVTANALRGESERCLAAGMDAFLTKPTTLDQLGLTLARWMQVPQAVEAGAAAEPAFDRRALAQLFGDDQPTIARLLVTFRDSARANLGEIDGALGRGDLPGVANAAHRIKGAARTVGAANLADTAQALEQAAKAADHPRAQDLAGRLAQELRRVEAEL